MAGPVLSCEGSPWRGQASGPWRANPHIQSYAIAMDEVSGASLVFSIRLFFSIPFFFFKHLLSVETPH